MAKDKLDKLIDETEKELTKNKKETTKVKNQTPKTVKVSTLIKIGIAIIAIVLSFVAGWTSNTAITNYDQNRIKSEAKALVKDLKSSK